MRAPALTTAAAAVLLLTGCGAAESVGTTPATAVSSASAAAATAELESAKANFERASAYADCLFATEKQVEAGDRAFAANPPADAAAAYGQASREAYEACKTPALSDADRKEISDKAHALP